MDQKVFTIYIIAFYRDNDLKLKFVRGKKFDILTKEAKNQSQKNVSLKKAYFWGHPVIQANEAIMLGPFCKIPIFTKYSVPEQSATSSLKGSKLAAPGRGRGGSRRYFGFLSEENAKTLPRKCFCVFLGVKR